MTADLTDTDARTDWGPQRSKTITWHEPGPSTAKGLTMAGLDYLQAMAEGRLPQPPISGLMEFAIVKAEVGRVVFTCQPDESGYNPIGAVHGGLICTLLDSVTGCAVHSTLPAGKGYTSIEIKVNYLKAVRPEQRRSHRRGHGGEDRIARRLLRRCCDRRIRSDCRHRDQHAPHLRSVGARDTFDGCRSGSW